MLFKLFTSLPLSVLWTTYETQQGLPLPPAVTSAVLQLHLDVYFDFSGAELHQPVTCPLLLSPGRYLRSGGAGWEHLRCWAPADGCLGWMWGTAGADGPAPSRNGCCDQPVGPHDPSWDLVVGRFQSWSDLCSKPSSTVTFTGSSAKKLHSLLMFSVKVLFFLFLLNLILNNLRSLSDLLPLSYLSSVFCLFPLSVLSHHHLDLFSRHSLPGFGAHRSTSADFSSAALTCTSKATVLWPLQSEQMLGFVWVYVAVSRSSEVQAGAKLLLAHVPGVLRLPTRRGGAWFLGWANRSTNNADSHQMFTETVHKVYVCFTASGLQWSLFPYFRKSLNLAGKTWWTSPEGLSIPGETNFFQLIIIVIFCKVLIFPCTLKWMGWNCTYLLTFSPQNTGLLPFLI